MNERNRDIAPTMEPPRKPSPKRERILPGEVPSPPPNKVKTREEAKESREDTLSTSLTSETEDPYMTSAEPPSKTDSLLRAVSPSRMARAVLPSPAWTQKYGQGHRDDRDTERQLG